LWIADFQLPIADFRLAIADFFNWQSTIDNWQLAIGNSFTGFVEWRVILDCRLAISGMPIGD